MVELKIHHTGIIVDNIEKNNLIYEQLGYTKISEVVTDDIQHVKIVFFLSTDKTHTIELIESLGEMSSIHNFKTGYHHICYDVSDIQNFLCFFKTLKIGRIFTKPMTAPAISDRKVVFACLNNGMFIEFIISR